MKRIYNTDDFELQLDPLLSNIEYKEGSKLTLKFYTVNKNVTYSIDYQYDDIKNGISSVKVSGNWFVHMEKGVVMYEWTASILDEALDDGVFNFSKEIMTDCYWAGTMTPVWYTKEETDNKISEAADSLKSADVSARKVIIAPYTGHYVDNDNIFHSVVSPEETNAQDLFEQLYISSQLADENASILMKDYKIEKKYLNDYKVQSNKRLDTIENNDETVIVQTLYSLKSGIPKISIMSSADYSALSVKDSSTYYFVTG